MSLKKICRRAALIMCAAVLSAGLFGCGAQTQQPAPASDTAGTTKAAETTAATTAGTQKEEPKLSGKLVVYSAGPADLATNIQNGFEAKTGVKIEMFQGTTGKILARIEAEKAKPVVDVVVLASLATAQGLAKDGVTLPYKEAENADKLFPQWSDKDGNFYSYSLSALGIAYNTKVVKTVPKSWNDIAGPALKGNVNIPDPALSGSALDFVSGYISVKGDAGWDLFKQYKANGVLMAGANQEALDPVISGTKGVVVAAVDYMTYQAKAKGEAIDLLYPEEGTVISPRPALIYKTSANVENAKAFIDYLLSDEAQKMIADAYLLPGRSDIKVEGRPGASEIPTLKVDMDWMNANQDSVIQKFTEIMK